MSFKVTYNGVSGKATRHYIIQFYNVGLISKASEEIASESTEDCSFRQPHCRLTSLSRESHEYPRKPYIARNFSHWAASSPLILWVYLVYFEKKNRVR